MAAYNLIRAVEDLLETHKSSPPSFIVKLERQHWYVNESKFTYNHQLAPLLDDIRAQRIPVDFLELFDSVGVPFYNGCMIVELHDFRPPKASDEELKEPVKTRVVLNPNGETLWADICLLNEKTGHKWTDQDALEVEARVLLATSPPLCLEPDPHLTRMVNSTMRVSVPTPPLSLKRKASAAELEDDPSGKARREKLMAYMNPRTRGGAPSFRVLDAIQRAKMNRMQATSGASLPPTVSLAVPPTMQMQILTGPMQVAAIPTPAPGVQVQASASVPTPAPPVVPTLTPTPAPPTVHATAPYSQPTPVSASTPVRTANTPPVNAPQNVADAKKKGKKTGAAPSPLTTRTSATPVASSIPLPIPQHMQAYQAHMQQMQVRTPPPPSQSPHLATSSTPGRSSTEAETRPPSTTQQLPTQPAQHIQQQANANAMQPQHNLPPYQPHMTAANFIAQVPYGKKKGTQPGVTPSQPQAIAYSQLMYQPYMQHQVAAAAQQRMQSTTPVARSPLAASQQGTPQRNSPMAANQPLVSRSPMPPNSQQSIQTTHPQQPHVYSYAMQGQYGAAAHMRPMAHPHAPHPQMQHHMAGAGAQAGAAATALQQGVQMPTQEQAQMMAQYQMYPTNYAHLQGRVPYWTMGIGRGTPVANQAAQMQLGANKTAQGGIQGS